MPSLYSPTFEHDSCGIGAVVSIDGKRTHRVVDNALSIVEKLEHRAGKDATGETGDGVGILVQISHEFFTKAARECGITLFEEGDYGVGMFFLPREKNLQNLAKELFEKKCEDHNLTFLGWRSVPVNEKVLGKKALECMPKIEQAFVQRPENVQKGIDFDKKLYVLRRDFEKESEKIVKNYVASLSSRTIVYKGMFLVHQLRTFYKDLTSEDYSSALAIVHSRFSTNTNPSWERAHPNRLIAHNGEINTIRGNADRMTGRAVEINLLGSDSAMLDNTLEYLMMNGLPLPLAIMICIPEPWKHNEAMESSKRDFYHYWATMMEEWDGPAAILFSDGELFGATLDRNGLRPCRYYVTDDNMLILSSEVGVLEIDEKSIVKKSRLEPGKILLVDTKEKRIISDEECKSFYAKQYPYGEWLDLNLLHLADIKVPNKKIDVSTQEERDKLYRSFGWALEDVNDMILPMAKNGVEPTASMGIDTPLAILSEKHPPLYSYFKQLFAQVTNPPIDSLREKIITDPTVYVGTDGNLLEPKSSNCKILEINNPVLTGVDVLKIKSLDKDGFRARTIPLVFELFAEEKKKIDLKAELDSLFKKIDLAYEEKCNILILSDRGVDEKHAAIPSLLAVSAVEQYLIRTHRRTQISIIIESGEIRDVHQVAMCLGYGARAVNPYLAHECIAELIDKKLLDKDYHTAIDDYNKALLNGVIKVAAKMGISTIQSYQSAQIFEAVGISKELIDEYFTNTTSRVGGITLKEIEEDIAYHHEEAYSKQQKKLSTAIKLEPNGFHKFKPNEQSEDHIITPKVIAALQDSTQSGNYEKFKEYAALVDDFDHPHTLRALLDFDYENAKAIPISEVESEESIVQRFKTGAMSYGSISEEAHKCLAEAMNHLHAKSNSGEGGENPERFGTKFNSAIKQVASGRFGVTEEYLLSAKEIQIKLAQGAKPGEGGHLPGKKVHPWIAKERYSQPGVSLISPPPHHDIYSIEDLAQLIYDLKNANRDADISVKLVSEAGVGTIAAGVAKADAQTILISGHDGGTGAAPISSIHHAGLPWELGLTETHQTLVMNGLRSRVRLETDGKLMTGRDVAIAAILGAEEFGFATAPLISMGCRMLRVCNLDTCPFGIATQNPDLRKKFPGKPEYVENFMIFTARNLREIMAKLGIRTLDEMIGKTELLKLKKEPPSSRASLLDVSGLIGFKLPKNAKTRFDKNDVFNFSLNQKKDIQDLLPLFGTVPLQAANEISCEFRNEFKIDCTDRTLGTILGSEIQKTYGSKLQDDSFAVHFKGGAGQSFGAFAPKGLSLILEGDANDYVGKGLSGGKIVIFRPKKAQYAAEENIIVGNVALYGATSGKIFINGKAGERFCVRNSGATAVVEGCGDHGLEYMTGGTAVILGSTGKNLCAGMSGGKAFVLDSEHTLYKKLNKELVEMHELESEEDKTELKNLIFQHERETDSAKAKVLLADFESHVKDFKVITARKA
ncbi:glutamate synthase large subunit [Treponema zioleckii]|uniref:glutamate synthase large subunit n=1 Tax=Treponema zioleckii TaxID=331680 RepID=UPI00168B6796|nr:glutamate synthase large subunit [Treponema zioleckii]